MCQILRPEEETKSMAQPRNSSKSRNDYFSRASDEIGRMSACQERRDPSENLRPDPNFRRANNSSSTGLWQNENNDLPLFE